MSINDRNVDMKELKKGIQMILTAFNQQKAQFIKIINSMKEKIILLEDEIVKLKEENNLYQNKLFTLQKNIKCISKTICQIKDDEESIEEKNNSFTDKYDKSNSIEQEDNAKLTKEKNNIFFKKHSLNKLEIKKPEKINNKIIQDLNNYFNDYYNREDDIKIKNKENIYLNGVYMTLNNKKNKNKKESRSTISNNINKENNNKSDNKEIKENSSDNNNNDNINHDK
jgi:hypothetical protein